jgi:hypothetical protein
VLDAQMSASDRVPVVRHVAGRMDPAHGCPAERIHDHPVRDLDGRADERAHVRFHAQPGDHDVTRDDPAGGRHDALDATVTLEPRHALAEHEPNP